MINSIKSIIVRLEALLILILFLPFFLIFYLLTKFTSKGPFIFKQKRLGKDKKIFTIYKIRTMINEAEQKKEDYQYLNEIDGPVFKIRNDPRYTKVGKFLSHTALDELPQLVNIIKGEMVFVGPRPLPLSEGDKIPNQYQGRFSVLPGMTSPWIIQGAHKLSFDRWMELDLEYVKEQSFLYDIKIFFKTIYLVSRLIVGKLKGNL